MPGLPGIHVFWLLHSKTWMAGTSPAMTALGASSKINQTDPVGYQRGFFLALDFNRHIGARLQFGRPAQLRLGERKAAADARPGEMKRNLSKP